MRKLADSLGYGTDRSPYLGSGNEYVQSRPYQSGDPVRAVDWRVTARTGRPFVKEYETPKQMPCHLVLDTSASMTISSHARSKYETAVHLAGALAFAALDRVAPVGLVGAGGRDLRAEPRLSPATVWRWLHLARRFRYDEPTAVGSSYRNLAARLLAQRHDCTAAHLLDPAERGLRGTGLMRGREAETGQAFVSHDRHAWADPGAVAADLRGAGVDHLLVPTDRPFIAEVRSFLRTRSRLGRGAR